MSAFYIEESLLCFLTHLLSTFPSIRLSAVVFFILFVFLFLFVKNVSLDSLDLNYVCNLTLLIYIFRQSFCLFFCLSVSLFVNYFAPMISLSLFSGRRGPGSSWDWTRTSLIELLCTLFQGSGSGFDQKTDPGLCTSNKTRLSKFYIINTLDNVKSLLFCFHTFGVGRSIDVLDSEGQPGYGSRALGFTEDV